LSIADQPGAVPGQGGIDGFPGSAGLGIPHEHPLDARELEDLAETGHEGLQGLERQGTAMRKRLDPVDQEHEMAIHEAIAHLGHVEVALELGLGDVTHHRDVGGGRAVALVLDQRAEGVAIPGVAELAAQGIPFPHHPLQHGRVLRL
jgi:hypothetical protein